MTGSVSGGCKCGQVRYRGQLASGSGFRCHCRHCQQLTGTGHSEMMPLVAATFEIDPLCRTYAMNGGSGGATFSGFCPNCGSPLTRRSERMAELVYVHASSLDDPTCYKPDRSIHQSAAQPWDEQSIIAD